MANNGWFNKSPLAFTAPDRLRPLDDPKPTPEDVQRAREKRRRFAEIEDRRELKRATEDLW